MNINKQQVNKDIENTTKYIKTRINLFTKWSYRAIWFIFICIAIFYTVVWSTYSFTMEIQQYNGWTMSSMQTLMLAWTGVIGIPIVKVIVTRLYKRYII